MKSLDEILKSDLHVERIDEPQKQQNRFTWLVAHNYDQDAAELLAEYAEALELAGVDLTNPDLAEITSGHFFGLEDAIRATLAKKDLRKPTAYFIAALRGGWKYRSLYLQPREGPLYNGERLGK